MDRDPIIHCRLDGHRTEMHRSNSGLYLFAGFIALAEGKDFDHVWVYNEEIDVAGYIWKDLPDNYYLQYAKFLIDNRFPIHKNLQEVQDVDRNAYNLAHQDIVLSENVIQFPRGFEGLVSHE